MANRGFVELGLVDVRNQEAADPATSVAFYHAPEGRLIFRSEPLAFPPRRRFELPAFPQSRLLYFEITPSRYRMRKSDFFRLTHGETVVRNLSMFRLPQQWQARFTPWSGLGEQFDPLKEVLENSPSLRVRGWRKLGPFTGERFDREEGGNRFVLPKTSLLNLFFKMSDLAAPTTDGVDWFSFIREILEIGRERLIALVDPRMGAIVRTIKSDISNFDEYKHSPAGNHFKNFPTRFQVRRTQMFSVKSTEINANLQLTFGPGEDADGNDVLLLDADIDENNRLFHHLTDVFKHKFTGGTHPFDIHDYLALVHPEAEFGYHLT